MHALKAYLSVRRMRGQGSVPRVLAACVEWSSDLLSVWSVPCTSEILKWRSLKRNCKHNTSMFQQKTLVLGISFLIRTPSVKVMHLMGKSSFIFPFARNRVVSSIVSFAICSYMYGAPLLHSLQKLKSRTFCCKTRSLEAGQRTVCKTTSRNAKC